MTAPSAPEARCLAALRGIAAYLDGELELAACTDIERHCDTCSSCARFMASLRLTVGLCRQAATAPLPEPVRARARARVEQLLDRLPPP